MKAMARMNRVQCWAGLIAIYFKERIHYRFEFMMTLFSSVFYSAMYFMVWKAIFANSTSLPMGWTELITYVMVGQAINMARFSPAERKPTETMGRRIMSGDIALDLLRPMGFQSQRFIEAFSYFLSETLWVNIPLLILFVTFLGVAPPATGAQAPIFFVSMLLAFLVGFGLNVIVLTLSFYTRNTFGAQVAKRAIIDIFAGTLIPFQLFPDWFRMVVAHLPFKAIAYIPLSIWTGRIAGAAALWALLEQVMWGALLVGLSFLIWRRAMAIITVQGG